MPPKSPPATMLAHEAVARNALASVAGSGRVMEKTIGSGKTIEELSDELADRCGPLFLQKDWFERLELLNQIYDQLKEDLDDMDLYCAISPVLVRKLIERLPSEPVTSVPQAQIYANSEAEDHRRLAGQWLRAHRGAR